MDVALSDSQKLDFLISSMVEVKKSQANLESLVTRVTSLEAKVALQDSAIASLQAEVKFLKERDNSREQQSRNNALRLYNFPGSDDETHLAGKVYDKVIKPILTAAKAKGDLSTLPQAGTTIENCFRVGRFAAGPNKPPPPIVIKFTTPAIRMAILKNKRNSTPPPLFNDKRLVLSEDLTPATHRKLRELMEDERVEKAWTLSGSIWVVRSGPNNKPFQVKSIFDPIDKILA